MNKKKALIVTLAGVGAFATALKLSKIKNEKVEKKITNRLSDIDAQEIESMGNAYFVGGGLASMAGAAYLIRDCGMPGNHIHIYEGMNILGGSNDGAGDRQGFVCRGGRMLNEETYENFWELFSSIPSLEFEGKSVTEEILNFDHLHPTHAQARLIDKDGNILDVTSMGFDNKDRLLLAKLMKTPEENLDDMTIEDWFKESPHFFETNFWYMWQTTFAFQKWSSLFEFKRYMNRMIFEFSRIETLEGVTRTPYNQYESLILPLKSYLENRGVNFHTDYIVTDIDFADGENIIAEKLYINTPEGKTIIDVLEDDICIMTNGCMTDCATLGNIDTAPEFNSKKPISGELWRKVSEKRSELGNPEPFFGNPKETNWESFTVTMRGNKLLKMIENFSGTTPRSGAPMSSKDPS